MAVAETTFTTFGVPHVTALVLTAALAVALPVWSRRARSAALTRGIAWTLAAILVANELFYIGWCFATEPAGEVVRERLPLHICGVAVFLTAWVLVRPNRHVYEVAWYWGMAGTLQALLTPNLIAQWPDYRFVQYFVTHSGIIIGTWFATWALGMRPGRWSVLRVFLLTALFTGVIAAADGLLGANYMFLCEPPRGASPFFFLPWPWYIPFLAAVGLAFFTLFYLPFLVAGRRPPNHVAGNR